MVAGDAGIASTRSKRLVGQSAAGAIVHPECAAGAVTSSSACIAASWSRPSYITMAGRPLVTT